MKYEKGLVSVIIPTYKRSEMLGRAIKSVVDQTYKNIEVIVISDNEPQDKYTMEVSNCVKQFSDERIIFIQQERHKNGAAARNTGIRAAKGEYIAFLDDDDWWEYKKLELQVNMLKKLGPEYGGVTCKNKHYCNGKLVAALPPIKDEDLCKSIMLRLADLSTDAILLKRECLDETGYFDENLRRHQEVQLMTFFTNKYKVKLLDMYLVCVDSTVNENQPNPEVMKKIKDEFMRSISPVLKNYPPRTQKAICAMHKFEIGLLYIKNGQVIKGFGICTLVLLYPQTIKYVYRYIRKKLMTKKNAEERVQKDAYTLLER